MKKRARKSFLSANAFFFEKKGLKGLIQKCFPPALLLSATTRTLKFGKLLYAGRLAGKGLCEKKG